MRFILRASADAACLGSSVHCVYELLMRCKSRPTLACYDHVLGWSSAFVVDCRLSMCCFASLSSLPRNPGLQRNYDASGAPLLSPTLHVLVLILTGLTSRMALHFDNSGVPSRRRSYVLSERQLGHASKWRTSSCAKM